MPEKVIVAWSGGKDSALALYEVLHIKRYEVLKLLTTVTQDYDRISIHGVRRVLLEQQVEALGFSLEHMLVPKGISDAEYERKMLQIFTRQLASGVFSVVFGDIFLEDVRKYREQMLAKIGVRGIFPLWKRNTHELASEFVDLGFKAVITCVDTHSLGEEFAGREFDKQFLADLPANIDPCGENGEFHSFVYDGPIFGKPILFTRGEVVLRENRFCYCDLVPIS
ncbi:MAG: diphthine--ammonia ligase [Candidatus Bathyarchaeota archaeon]|nr:diphthine--ammonia ligase [Candidatus Bathyarchaeota archaeon]